VSRNQFSSRPSHRAIHLVDLDNLVAGPSHPERVPAALATYLAASGYRTGDHLYVASDRTLAATAVFEIPVGSRYLVARGPDGADRRLLEVAPAGHIAQRYSNLVIGSGDGAFADLALAAGARGMAVTVLACAGSISRRLQAAAGHTITLPPHPTEVLAA
jgi:hypothetical protein